MQDPTAPGALLGYRSNGRPIYLIAGGDETNDNTAGQGQQDAGQQGGSEDAEAQRLLAEASGSGGGESSEGEKGQESKTFDEAYVKKLRDENASTRVEKNTLKEQLEQEKADQQERMDAIAKALGLKEEEGPPDPEKLTQQLTEAQKQAQEREQELRTLQIERAAERAARTHSADVDALLDSRSFASQLANLDPSANDFETSLNELVKTTVENNPKYKASQAPAASSADFSSGTGEQRKRPSSLYDAVSRSFG